VLENGSEEGKIKAPKPMKTGTTIAGVVYKVIRNQSIHPEKTKAVTAL